MFARRLVVACLVARTLFGASGAAAQSGESALDRRVSLSLTNATLVEAFTELRRARGVSLAWSGDVVPASMRVTLHLNDVPLRNAFAALLSGSGLDVAVTPGGTIVIIPRPAASPAAQSAQSQPAVDEIKRALTATGVPELDRVVVIGSAVAASPEREQPTAVTVIDAARVAELSSARATDVMRVAVPGVVFWDRGPIGPPAPIATVRGIASFTTRALKTYVDGIEVASPELFTLVDGRAIARVEMIRGPQGAALYGPDALNGILRIETGHGRLGRRTTHARLSAGGGFYDRDGMERAAPSQDYFAGIEGANNHVSYAASGAFATTGSAGEVPLARSWGVHSGARALAGPVILNASVRAAQHEYALERPRIAGGSSDAGGRIPQSLDERAVALTAVHHIRDGLRETLVAGHHRISGAREPFRSPLLPPRLPLGATHETAERTSLRYSATADVSSALTLSGGAEYSVRRLERAARRTPTATELSHLYNDDAHSTGAFAQARVHVGERLIVSGGVRGEDLSSVGPNLGTVWASTAGATWSRGITGATLRLRAAWGSGIRPPEPGMDRAASTDALTQAANPDLAPERQRGIEGGLDLYFARGPFIRLTLYDQRATDLIQQVQQRTTGAERATYQYQNIGIVRNRGAELEGGARVGRVTASAALHVLSSRVLKLSPRYSGELQPGDRLVEVPEAAGALSLRYDASRLHAELGATWLGPWTGYDWIAITRAEQGQTPARDTPRDYWLRYDGVVRPYVTVAFDATAHIRVQLRADNPARSADLIRDNLSPPLGRTAMIGIELRSAGNHR